MVSSSLRPVALAGVILATALALLGWWDYRAVTRDLRASLGAQAAAIHGTVASAARTQHLAAEQAEASLVARLLEAGRLLGELDGAGRLTPALLDAFAARDSSLRVVVFSPAGTREAEAGERPGRGSGAGAGRGFGRPPWGGAGALTIAERVIAGEADEIVTASHPARDGRFRTAAGVRRANRGAIVLTASSDAARRLDDVYSLSTLIVQIAAATPALAYVVADVAGQRVAGGALGDAAAADDELRHDGDTYRTIGDVQVLEYCGDVELGEETTASLRVGMRLDAAAHSERRTLVRTITGGVAAYGLAMVALAFVSLRRRFGVLSEEHERAQAALQRRDRLAAMGELASTVAHEIRNPLNAIAMSAQRLAREYPPPAGGADREELAELLGVVQRESARINTRIEQFLRYGRPRPLNRTSTRVKAMLDAIAASGSSLGQLREVRVSAGCEPGLEWSLDAAQMAEAIENLVRNAVEASSPNGTVRITAARQGPDLVIEVSDHGPGIAPEVLPRIFDLYFTTRPDGTGVGLPLAHQIVTAHGGTIEVDSSGAGTTMRVRVPPQGTSGE